MDHGAESSLSLLARARAGDGEALNQLLHRYLPRLRRWATGRLPRPARHLLDTDDVVQDTIVKAVRNLGHVEVRDEGALQAYLRQGISNKLVDVYRKMHDRVNDTVIRSDIPANQPSPLEEAIGADMLRTYEEGLARLTASDRELVILRIELCYDYEEIARMVGKNSAASARMAVSRAIARLAEEMDQAG